MTGEYLSGVPFRFYTLGYAPGPNVIKLFIALIYCHSMVILLFCVIKQHYFGNYCRMAVNYHGISVTNAVKHDIT
jgi:hypothetical protein